MGQRGVTFYVNPRISRHVISYKRERKRKYRVPTECAFKGHMNRCMHSLNLHKSQLYALLNCPEEDREIIIMRISSCMRQVGERGKREKRYLNSDIIISRLIFNLCFFIFDCSVNKNWEIINYDFFFSCSTYRQFGLCMEIGRHNA